MKRAAIWLVVMVSLAAAPTRPVAAGYEGLFKQVRAASWALYVRSTKGLETTCSATAYASSPSETRLFTAGHCFVGLEGKTDVLVTQDHFTFIPATLVRTGLKLKQGAGQPFVLRDYEGDDWAIITARVGRKPTMPVGSSARLVIGEDLIMVGLPFGLDFLAVQGIVGSTDVSMSQLLWHHYYGANIYIAAGNSGAAIVSPKQKAIVGILVAGPGEQSSMAIFAPIDIVKR